MLSKVRQSGKRVSEVFGKGRYQTHLHEKHEGELTAGQPAAIPGILQGHRHGVPWCPSSQISDLWAGELEAGWEVGWTIKPNVISGTKPSMQPVTSSIPQ